MVTYKEKTQTWQFEPPYPRGVWLFEIIAILGLTGAIVFTNPLVLKSLLFPSIYHSRQFSSPVVSILLIAVAVSIPRLAFVCTYVPRAVHLTYDELIVRRGFGKFMTKRMPYCHIESIELVYCNKSGWVEFAFSPFYWIFLNCFLGRIDETYGSDRSYKVSITLKNGRVLEFQVESCEKLIDLVEERMEKFRPQHRTRQR